MHLQPIHTVSSDVSSPQFPRDPFPKKVGKRWGASCTSVRPQPRWTQRDATVLHSTPVGGAHLTHDVEVSVSVATLASALRFRRRDASIRVRVQVEAVLVERTLASTLVEVLARLFAVKKSSVEMSSGRQTCLPSPCDEMARHMPQSPSDLSQLISTCESK